MWYWEACGNSIQGLKLNIGLETDETTGLCLCATIHCQSIADQGFTLGKTKEILAISNKGT